ncbi:MAG: pilus assembly protein [Actinomycetaceae bacterium]|nr:pilus assembly protein [Actinomycetaceae bacterium]
MTPPANHHRRTHNNYECGAATVEFALTLPAAMGIFLLLISVAMAGALKLHTCDIARTAARHNALYTTSTPYIAPQRPWPIHVSTITSDPWVQVTAEASMPRFLSPLARTLNCSVTTIKEN